MKGPAEGPQAMSQEWVARRFYSGPEEPNALGETLVLRGGPVGDHRSEGARKGRKPDREMRFEGEPTDEQREDHRAELPDEGKRRGLVRDGEHCCIHRRRRSRQDNVWPITGRAGTEPRSTDRN